MGLGFTGIAVAGVAASIAVFATAGQGWLVHAGLVCLFSAAALLSIFFFWRSRRSGGRRARAFISHSWQDKQLARRVARRLSHRGVRVWMDEAEVAIGTALSQRLADAIRASTYLVVVLSKAALESPWVTQEIKTARQQASTRVTILPLIAERGLSLASFDVLGVELFDPLTFEEQMDAVAGLILGHPSPEQRDPALLSKDLGTIAREAPELAGWIRRLADKGNISHELLDSLNVDEENRHAAETALIALHERSDAEARAPVSWAAAVSYRHLGVGYPVLRRQLTLNHPGSDKVSDMCALLGARIARTEDFEGIFHLLRLASPSQDLVFGQFVEKNIDRFNEEHKEQAVQLLLNPERRPSAFVLDAAFILLSHLPENEALQSLWWSWVNDYSFGGRPGKDPEGNPSHFFGLMNQAVTRRLLPFDPIMERFQVRFRNLVRSGDVEKIRLGIGLLITAVSSRYLKHKELTQELAGALTSSEWEKTPGAEALRRPISDLADAIWHERNFDQAFDTVMGTFQRIEGRR
jgi:hypothetical protein